MFFLAIRHLVNRPHQTVLTFIGITLGAAGYIVFSGLQLGYQDYVTDRLVNVDAYVRISPRDRLISADSFDGTFFPGSAIRWITPPSGRRHNAYLSNVQGWFTRLRNDPRVIDFAPQLVRQVIIARGEFSYPVRLIGINPSVQRRVTNMERDMTYGSLMSIAQGDSLILASEYLTRRLGTSPGGSVTIVNADGTVYPVKIVCLYRTGVKQIDELFVYSSLSTVQKVTRSPGEISDIAVRLRDVDSAAATAIEWSRYTEDRVESWDQSKEDIRVTLKTQRIVRNATTFTIMLIIAFGIYNILNMVVNQKKREIAILRSLGYTSGDTIFLFLVQGIILGTAGGLAGMAIGALACGYIETIKIEAGAGHMPMSWDTWIYWRAFVIVFISCVVASFIPARAAGRLSPIETIRGST